MKQTIIIISGHICSGKSTLSKILKNKIPDLVHLDILDYYKQYEEQIINGIDGRAILLYEDLISSVFAQKNVCIEVHGDEEWLPSFIQQLRNTHLSIVQVQLRRETEDLIQKCVYEREGGEVEIHYGIEGYYQPLNSSAKEFKTTQYNIDAISDEIMQEIIIRG